MKNFQFLHLLFNNQLQTYNESYYNLNSWIRSKRSQSVSISIQIQIDTKMWQFDLFHCLNILCSIKNPGGVHQKMCYIIIIPYDATICIVINLNIYSPQFSLCGILITWTFWLVSLQECDIFIGCSYYNNTTFLF